MSPEEFKKEMKWIKDTYSGDTECCHIRLDESMCKLLRDLGYGEGVDIFEKTEKLYA